jgi:site-specific recombinase XerD
MLQNKVYIIHSQLLQRNETVTAEIIKNKLLGISERPRMILEIFQQHNDQIKSLIGNGYAPLTLRRYITTLEHTREFFQWKYRINDLDINKLSYELISDFEFYLKSVRKCGHNTAIKYLTNFKKIVLLCVKKGWLQKDPFYGFSLATKQVVRQFLTQEEIDRIASKTFSTERLTVTRDIFLFSCYTGLAYVDVYNLKRSDIGVGIDSQKWIFSRRQKTETPFHIPLLSIPLQILERYKDHPKCINEDKALPVWSNQKLNEYLKEIADLCGVKKRLTYHLARHTFATTVTLNNGVPIETVCKMLGHKHLKITQHYAKTLDLKISADMQVLKSKIESCNSSRDIKTEAG